MRAVVFEATGRVRLDRLPDPAILAPTDAVIRVTRSGICGSDMHFFRGKAPLQPGEGMGHEAVGVIEAVGGQVRRFVPGDRVVVAFTVACGACWFCRHGQTQLCERAGIFGAGPFAGSLPGAQAERLRVPAADVNLLGIPQGVDDERALFVGDVLSTGFCAAAEAGAGSGETVAVIGAGPVGYLCAQALRVRGAGCVVVLDRDTERLELARAAGAHTVDVAARNPQMALADLTDGRGADAVIDAVGSPAAFESATDVVRRGGRVVIVGMYAGETLEAQLGVWWSRALELRFIGPCPVHAFWEEAMAALTAGAVDPTPLISHRLPLEDAQRGYELFDARAATKVVLVP